MEKSPHTVNFLARFSCTTTSWEPLGTWLRFNLSVSFKSLSDSLHKLLAKFIAKKGSPGVRLIKQDFLMLSFLHSSAVPARLSGCDKLASAEDNAMGWSWWLLAQDSPLCWHHREDGPTVLWGETELYPLGPPQQLRDVNAQQARAWSCDLAGLI